LKDITCVKIPLFTGLLICACLLRSSGIPKGMKVLIADNERFRDFLQDFVKQNQDSQVSGTAVDADGSPECVVARELRRILDDCPICQGGFRDHTYSVLATLSMEKKADGEARLAQFLRCLRDCRWYDVQGFRQWIASADTIVAFAFCCAKGRVGVVTVFSPADSEAPDEPLHFTILSVEEGKKLLAILEPGHWMHFRPTLHPVHGANPRCGLADARND
jgi:hypothetical protein